MEFRDATRRRAGSDFRQTILLTAAVALLGVNAIRPWVATSTVQAQSDRSYLFVEPGTTILRTLDGRGQVQGKVVIDLRNGDIFGYPTASSAPFPVVSDSHEPPVSKPIYLGKFDLDAMADAKRAVKR